MNERPMYFGPDRGLLGILTIPTAPSPGAPALVLLNAGLLHRVGPNRLYVDLARRLAGQGHAVLRFDMSGVGDSELREGGLLYIERAQHDVVEAMDAVASATGADQFILVGLCTGAFNAFRAALRDDRVAGCVLLDGYAYPTFRSRLRHYQSRVLQLRRWMSYLGRKLGLGGSVGEANADDDLIIFENEVVPKERFGRELKALIDREVPVLMVYTRLGPLPFNYERQMHEAFPDLDLDSSVVVRYYPDADHTFTLPGNRTRLLEEIEAWTGKNFGGIPVGSAGGMEMEAS